MRWFLTGSGHVGRMSRAIREATFKRFHYENQDQIDGATGSIKCRD
jgi:hypothetical protein